MMISNKNNLWYPWFTHVNVTHFSVVTVYVHDDRDATDSKMFRRLQCLFPGITSAVPWPVFR